MDEVYRDSAIVYQGDGMAAGNVVVLNGTSSSGKSSVARALQARMPTPYLHTGVDHFLSRLPAWCYRITDEQDTERGAYFDLVYRGGGQRITSDRPEGIDVHGSGELVNVRIGEDGLACCAACIALLLRSPVLASARSWTM